MISNPKDGTFEEGRRQLMRWPYTIHAIDGSLNTEMIEARARQILYQALNNRNVTAFMGAGVSAAYGRLGWGPWKKRQLEVVRRNAEAFVEMSRRSEALIGAAIELLSAAEKALIAKKDVGAADALELHVLAGLSDEDALGASQVRLSARNCALMIRPLSVKREEVRFVLAKIASLRRSFERADSKSGEFPGGESWPAAGSVDTKIRS